MTEDDKRHFTPVKKTVVIVALALALLGWLVTVSILVWWMP